MQKVPRITNFTVRIPGETYTTLLAYKERFKPYMSLNALIVEAIIEKTGEKQPAGAGEAV